jgi:hypothetical protein
MNNSIVTKRAVYLKMLMRNRKAAPSERLREVYLDESYIHQHYNRLEDSLFDSNDEQDEQLRVQHKGKRYCFLSVI